MFILHQQICLFFSSLQNVDNSFNKAKQGNGNFEPNLDKPVKDGDPVNCKRVVDTQIRPSLRIRFTKPKEIEWKKYAHRYKKNMALYYIAAKIR